MTGTIITISHHGFHLCWLYEALQGRVPEVPSSPSLTDNALISRGIFLLHEDPVPSFILRTTLRGWDQEPLSWVKRLELTGINSWSQS